MASTARKEYHVSYCGGRACPTCHKCSDWYYNPYEHTANDSNGHAYGDHVGPLIGRLYNWHRRVGSTCGYHAYPHYVYFAAYHGSCPFIKNRCPPFYTPVLDHNHVRTRSAIHGPHICHCPVK